MVQAGAHVKEEVCRALVVLVSNAPELHAYAVRQMYTALKTNREQLALSLLMVTTWFLGASGGLQARERACSAHALYLIHSVISFLGAGLDL